MRILLDENLPHDLRHELIGHEVSTVAYMQWSGLKNGQLLAVAASNGFDCLITMDSGVQFQQNLASLPLSVIVVKAKTNAIDDLRPLLPQLLTVLATLMPKSFTRIG